MSKLTIAGREITLKAVKVKNLSAVCAACEPFLDAFDEAVERDLKKGMVEKTTLFKLIGRHADHFVRLCLLLSDAEREWIEDLEPIQLFELGSAVITHSGDFFLAQIAEPLKKIHAQLVSLCLQASSGSSAPDTGQKPS